MCKGGVGSQAVPARLSGRRLFDIGQSFGNGRCKAVGYGGFNEKRKVEPIHHSALTEFI
jgi:hypothetical protein